jgi:PUB domain
LKDPSEEKFR